MQPLLLNGRHFYTMRKSNKSFGENTIWETKYFSSQRESLINSGQPYIWHENDIFTHTGTIIHIEDPKNVSDEIIPVIAGLVTPVKYEHRLILSAHTSLNESPFRHFLYSLLFVENYQKPAYHIMKTARKITFEDYETIYNGWLYLARTAFGELMNKLPKENKLEFMLLVMEEFNTIDFIGLPFERLTPFLIEYIRGRIFEQGKLLIETDKLISELKSTGIDGKLVGFIGSADPRRIDLVSEQAERFSILFDLEKKLGLFEQLSKSPPKHKTEARFEFLFKNKQWPVFLEN